MLRMLFCVPNTGFLYDLQMNIAAHFFLASIKPEFANMEKVTLQLFFMISDN